MNKITMKQTAKILFTILLLACTLAFCMVGCKDKTPNGAMPTPEIHTATIVIVDGETTTKYPVNVALFPDNSTVGDVLVSTQFADTIKAVVVKGDYGDYITSIHGMTPDAAKKEFIAIYTSIADMSSTEYGKITVDSKEYGSASKGVSELPLQDNAVYVFAISTY